MGCCRCTNPAVKGSVYCTECISEKVNEVRRYYDMQSWADVDPGCDCISCQGYPDHPLRP